jgi:hypothetical protein
MLNHFWQKIPSFQGETRPKPITQYDPNVFHPAAICRGPISDAVDLGLVEVFQTASSFARPDPFTSFDPLALLFLLLFTRWGTAAHTYLRIVDDRWAYIALDSKHRFGVLCNEWVSKLSCSFAF